jgi:ATP-dependent helicase HrpA
MELGRGVKGLIGHTQPRRLAARTVANRIAEELQTEPGAASAIKSVLAITSATTPWSS